MIAQERTPRWQIVRLTLRTLRGWGYSASDLRRSGQSALTAFKFFSVLLLAPALGGIVWASAQPAFGADSSFARFAARVPPQLTLSGILFAIMVCALGLIGIFTLRRAEQWERELPTMRYGYCFSIVILEPLHLFALIGLTREQAQWFHMPIAWEPTVEPGSDRYEMTVNPASGFVERLRRIGAESLELIQQPGAYTRKRQTPHVRALNGEATAEQRVTLTRAARKEGVGWGVASKTLRSEGISGIILGIVGAIALILLFGIPKGTPQPLFQARNIHLLIGYAWFAILGAVVCAQGARKLRMSSRNRRFETAPPIVVEGEQVCWAPYVADHESLVVVRLDDGDQLIFRIPERWTHRVRHPNTRVRVTYNEQSWRVVDYRVLATA